MPQNSESCSENGLLHFESVFVEIGMVRSPKTTSTALHLLGNFPVLVFTGAEPGRLSTSSSASRFDPRTQRLPIFHLILGGRSESLLRKPGFP